MPESPERTGGGHLDTFMKALVRVWPEKSKPKKKAKKRKTGP